MSVAADVRQLADALPTVVEAALGATALDAKKAFLRVAADASGGDSRLSRVGKRGTKIGARFDHVADGHVVVRAVGPWQFVEYPRRGGYPIPAKKGEGPELQPSLAPPPRRRRVANRADHGRGDRPAPEAVASSDPDRARRRR
jgi:hypothetical protein